ncbi:MAG: saccharopine dehydrogenase NADP-binding domain-containing protein [Candidatus Diapherotrites archaeon]|nr:saccharopine dehydrogenase NADP-binding domain-containing protein [Candidatus Diapherotrites archaeon]
MAFNFVVIGATGIQGRIVARDLLENGYSVLLCGRDKKRVDHLLKRFKKTGFEYLDARNTKKMARAFHHSKAGVVVNCVEGDWNLNILKACIKAGINCIDLGSEIPMTKQQFSLHEKLKRRGLTHITGCGSVPGIGNVMLSHAAKKFDSLHSVEVGFAWNSNMKKFVVPFSIESIIEEFTEPATNVKNGKFIKSRPMDSLIKTNEPFVGKEERFYVRHPETYTFYHYFKHKGLKNVRFYAEFPPHSFEVIQKLIEVGLGRQDKVLVDGAYVRPIDVLTQTLKGVKIPEGYREKENLWVRIYGKKQKKRKSILIECIAGTLPHWEDAGCNIDTGMPASIIAQMIKEKIITERGSFAPEAVVPPAYFFKELHKRKMSIYENGKKIN